MKKEELRYLQRLAELYPTIGKASTEIINLQSILNLPKGTEHFMSDLHGEYEAFSHVLRNGSGAVRKKIDDVFGHTLSNHDKRDLATLIYYPREKIRLVKKTEDDMENWYKITLYRLIEVCKTTASKYTRSKVRKALPHDYAYVIEELITEKAEVLDKEAYYNSIVNTIIEIRRAENFIIALAELIQRLVVDHLHILGDIFDRGPGPHFIMDRLMEYHSLDIQWGNHDVVWMGAAVGQGACIATVLRNSIRYDNLDILEDGYGINLLPLATFALETYKDDPCQNFEIKGSTNYNVLEKELSRKMHKAVSIIQFKLEGQLLMKRKEFHMEDRCLLHRIDPDKGTITMPDGIEYPLKDMNFPTVDWEHPYELTEGEHGVMERLETAFRNCEKLQNHMRFLLDRGGLYKIYNNNLLFHGCIPLKEDGSLKEIEVYGEKYKGRALYDALESYVRRAFFAVDPEEQEQGRDILWYIWASPNSPLFGKDKMTTFERYFIEDKETHKEKKGAYYRFLENEEVVDGMLKEFGLDPLKSHIINGHVPVHQSEGESPVKCGGKLIVIDGGLCTAYQKVTGIAGYTLIYNSYGLFLAAHEPFTSAEEAVSKGNDIVSSQMAVHYSSKRRLVGDTDNGRALRERIQELESLLDAYRKGTIKETK
ncbi:fructose-1,6-bisphosphatase [Blautia sp.]|jgi:fructose-1,6-bisphosphatase-3|uniref:fructose-1,6-bisphosphatase n=1 Tax=Blautia sp. TaxID=1955243 RepID=UPI002943ABEB|nr:fructose-1,6-bisphosphatase [Blautia sp.]MDY3016547.1 fructose-1,6-bisphosphatase [Blautia sp.]MED9882618.1 fructose-1,6-bisphosphatase [Blautia sp.]